MSNSTFIKNLFFLLHKRSLVTSSKLSSPPPQITKDSDYALHFLKNTCGLPLKSAISLSHTFPIEQKNENKLNSVINFLKDEGFSQSHISILIQKLPVVLHSKVETTLKPKLEFLKQNGFVGELLIELLIKSPSLFHRSIASTMKPAIELLRSYIVSDDEVVIAIRRSLWLLSSNVEDVIKPNIEFLVKQGVPSASIAKFLILKPRIMFMKQNKAIYIVNAVKNLGLQPSSPMFVHAFIIMSSMSESTWKKKMQFLQSFGWTQELILSGFKGYPYMMGYSEGKIRKSMDFYLNTVKFDMQTITTKPVLLAYAIDTRVRPRYNVLKILESKKLIKKDKHRLHVDWIILSNKKFLDKYIIKYEGNIPSLLDVYNAGKKAEKTDT